MQYITWITDNKVTWTLNAGAVGADPLTEIKARPITDEPLVRVDLPLPSIPPVILTYPGSTSS